MGRMLILILFILSILLVYLRIMLPAIARRVPRGTLFVQFQTVRARDEPLNKNLARDRAE